MQTEPHLCYHRLHCCDFLCTPFSFKHQYYFFFMARITVEDCLQHIPSRFELVVISAKRARQIAEHQQSAGIVDHTSKPTLIALREIAESSIDIRPLYQNKEEQEKEDIEKMLNNMQMIDAKLSADEKPDSNVHLIKQPDDHDRKMHTDDKEVMGKQDHQNPMTGLFALEKQAEETPPSDNE